MRVFSATILAALLAGTVCATTLKEGTTEISVSGLIDLNTHEGNTWVISAGGGYLIQDNLEIGGRFNLDENDDSSRFGAGVFGQFNLDLYEYWLPYIAAEVSVINADFEVRDENKDDWSETALAFTATIGTQYFITDKTALDMHASYTVATDDVFADGDKPKGSDLTFLLGLRFYFD